MLVAITRQRDFMEEPDGEEPKQPEMKLNEREHAELKELLAEANEIGGKNLMFDMQKAQLLQTMNNNQVAYQRLMGKVQKRFGIPDGSRVDVDAETGVLRMSGQRMMMGGPPQ